MTNFTNLGVNIFLPALPMITAGLRHMADALGMLGDWFGKLPKAGMAAATGAFAIVAASEIYAASPTNEAQCSS